MPRRTASPPQQRSSAAVPFPACSLSCHTRGWRPGHVVRRDGPRGTAVGWPTNGRDSRRRGARARWQRAAAGPPSPRHPACHISGWWPAELEDRGRRHVTDRVGAGAAGLAADAFRCSMSRLALDRLAWWPACHRSGWRREPGCRGRRCPAWHVMSGVGPPCASTAASGMSHLWLVPAQPWLLPALSGAACAIGVGVRRAATAAAAGMSHVWLAPTAWTGRAIAPIRSGAA